MTPYTREPYHRIMPPGCTPPAAKLHKVLTSQYCKLYLLAACVALSWFLHVEYAHGQRVSIGLFDSHNVQSITLIPESNNYSILFLGKRIPLNMYDTCIIARSGYNCQLAIRGQSCGNAAHIAFISPLPEDRLTIQPSIKGIPPRKYDGNLSLYTDFGRLMCVNLIEQELYVAAVVLAEVGPKAEYEMYKAQALLVRTYLYAQRERHLPEGFNLCDEVHCQAYNGSAYQHPQIIQAAEETKGLVLVDKNQQLITSVFHANCGGQTASSSDVWLTNNDHLRSVIDPFCRKGRGASWKAILPLADWKRFLQSKGINTQDISHQSYNYSSGRREAIYALPKGIGVPFRDLREYFNLKSAWFDVQIQGENVLLSGRGYGHGIGLCQEGAMRMASEGKKAEEIILFYFHGVRIVRVDQIVPPGE